MVSIFLQDKVQPKRGKRYVYHAFPTGTRPVTANEEGKQKYIDWGFQYSVWDNVDKQHCQVATTNNLFLEETRVELDEDMLTALVLTDHRMKTWGALFFFQVLWPMCHQSKSYIVNDTRVPHFTSVGSFTKIYKFSTGQGGSYGQE